MLTAKACASRIRRAANRLTNARPLTPPITSIYNNNYQLKLPGGVIYSMYSQDLIRRISDDTHLSQKVIGEVLTSERKVIKDTLKSGQEVRVPGFGVFYVRSRKAGRVKSIRTRKMVEVPARRVPAFRPGQNLKRALYKPKRG